MASWEDTKRAAQTTYSTLGSIYQNAYEGIGNAYQQILTTGRLYPDHSSLTHDIATGAYEPTKEDWEEYGRWSRENEPPDPRLTGIDPDAPEPEP